MGGEIRNMKKRVFIIHGWVGRPDRHWYPWLKTELQSRGIEVIVPAMPNTQKPALAEWLQKIKDVVGQADEQTFFVGHSVGANAVLRYIAGLPPEEKVGGVVLVAGLIVTKKNKLLEFVKEKLDYKKIKKHIIKKVVVIHSDNDPIIPMSDAELVRDNLDAQLIIVPKAWHFDDADGWTELPQARDALLKMMKSR